MKLLAATCSLILLSTAPSVYAWGDLGHQTVAYIATNFVAPETKTFFQRLLANDTALYLAGVANWADTFRKTPAGRFSGPYHFIDAIDNPPASCAVAFSRDCPQEGCVVSAIRNYTDQILNKDLSADDRATAAKFVVHFLGDIHQPLHDENIAFGGNGIRVRFNGVNTSLHHAWDDNIPEQLIGNQTLAASERWATTLSTAITSGIYKSQAASWLQGIDLRDPVGTALVWASDANALICTNVMPEGPEPLENRELNGTYYEAAVPVVQLQVAKAGYRLAKWLDVIAAAGYKTEL